MIAVALLWGPHELLDFGNALGARVGSAEWDLAPDKAVQLERWGITVDTIRSSRILSTLYALAKILFFTSGTGWGSHALGIALTLAIPLVLAGKRMLQLRSLAPLEQTRSILLLLGSAVVPIWYCMFVQHTIIHANFMFRPMVWPLALLMAGEALSLKALHAKPAIVT
jgi:hypothetical protein